MYRVSPRRGRSSARFDRWRAITLAITKHHRHSDQENPVRYGTGWTDTGTNTVGRERLFTSKSVIVVGVPI